MKLLFNTLPYSGLAQEILEQPDNELVPVSLERNTFPDGEKYMRIKQHVAGADCVILGGTQDTESIFEIMNLGYGITTSGARSLTIVIPYFGYQTMERSSNPGEIVMAKNMAHWLSSIPSAAHGNRILLLEPHTDTIPYYFGANVTTRAIPSLEIIMRACVELAGTSFVLGSTDVGRAKTIEYIQRAFAAKHREYNVETAFVYKRRESGTETKITGVNADVSGKDVVIYDDMFKTGGSLVGAARVYKEAGANKVYAVATHGVLPGSALRRILACDDIEAVAMTNSHPNAEISIADLKKSDWTYSADQVRMYSVASLLSHYI